MMESELRPPLIRRLMFFLLVIVTLLAIAGFFYENIAETRDRRFHPMIGQWFDVEGHKMHIYCTGEGSPTVILDSGLEDSFLSWRKVQPGIAKFVRVCSYDRAGLGYSEPSSRPRTSRVIAEELHGLLQAAHVAPPYVLVGHSMGGSNVRVFASLYRAEVAGMVLVDADHPDQANRLPPAERDMERSWRREAEFLAYTTPFGVPRLLGLCDDDPAVRAAECNFHQAREVLAEMETFAENAAETATTGTLGDLPLAVVSHDPETKPSQDLPADIAQPANQVWETMQEELAHLSTRGTRTIARNSSHYIPMDRPDVVIEAVQGVVQQARTATAPTAAGDPHH